MKAIDKPKNNYSIKFDLTAPIRPLIGLGGILFTQTIKDFEEPLINKSFDTKSFEHFDYSVDSRYFSLNIQTKEIEIEINLFTGKICSMICRQGYLGRLENNVGIGTSIRAILDTDKNFGFNLDTDWFDRTPFDGLIIYPPIALKDKCVDAAVNGTKFPDFDIEVIELIDLEFAREHFPDGQLTFE